jgi:signal transduction histidine kinase
VLLNLLSNAIKYSPEGKMIHLSIEIANNGVSVRVKDEGIGIPAEEQQNLFAKYYRATNVTNIQGTGLGLNIVKRYVELLRGAISFVSEPGVGTTFIVKFPQN